VEDAVDEEPPQAAKESAIADAVISASAFFIVISPSCFFRLYRLSVSL